MTALAKSDDDESKHESDGGVDPPTLSHPCPLAPDIVPSTMNLMLVSRSSGPEHPRRFLLKADEPLLKVKSFNENIDDTMKVLLARFGLLEL